ncbi:MAG: transglutaminase domain-containing protein [Planctomycetota bacterium]
MAAQGTFSSRELRESRYAWCLLPTLLLLEAVFVGSTFKTTWWVLGVFALAASVVTIVLVREMQAKEAQSRAENKVLAKLKRIRKDTRHAMRRPLGVEAEPIGKPPSGKSALAITIAFVGFFVGVSLRVGHHMQGNLNPVAMLVDSLAHGTLFATVAFWVCFPRRGHPIMLPSGLVLVLCSVTAGGVSHSMSGQLLAAFGTVLAFSLASGHILRHWQLIAAARAFRYRKRKSAIGVRPAPLPAATASSRGDDGRTGVTFTILAVSALLMLTTVAGQLASVAIPGMQLTFLDRLSQTLESVTSSAIIGGTKYVRGSELGQVRRHMIGDPAEPAVRVYAERTPGYLRGNVFDSYNRGRWRITSRDDYEGRGDRDDLRSRVLLPASRATVETTRGSIEKRRRYRLRGKDRPDVVGTLEIHNVPTKGTTVFTALSTEWIEAEIYSDLEVSYHDVIATGTVNSKQPYVLGIGADTAREVIGEAKREVMLTIPSRLKNELTKLASSICSETITPRGKAQAIEAYFQANFKYSLQRTVSPKNVDPLLHFLNTQHPSHCEFFASAAAMLLRSVGVPTRYVTGYVATEWSDENDYYLARNRDAHAWVEAYDNLSEQWFPVEATVGRTYVTLTAEEEDVDSDDVTNNDLENADESVSIIDRFFAFLGSFRTADSLTFLFRIAQLPLFCMVVVLMWIRHRQRQRKGDDPMEFESRKMLLMVDRRLRKHDLVRAPNETLHQFAIRVDTAAETNTPTDKDTSDLLSTAAEWYRSFASARYRGLMPLDWAEFNETQTATV